MEYSVSLFFTLSVLALILWMLGVWSLRIYNNLVFTQNNAFKAFANIDVLLVQRSDEVPNLETIVNELSEHRESSCA